LIPTKNAVKSIIEYGDYQTPSAFTLEVCKKLRDFYALSPKVVIEPTFGTGNFLESIIRSFDNLDTIYGIELNTYYYAETVNKLSRINHNINMELFNDDIFSFDFSEIKDGINKTDQILIVGNPPWATNTQLSSIGSYNLPMKDNFKGNSGLDAITGKGNFDIAEYIILQLLSEFEGYNCCLAMLCKNIVAKNIVRDMDKYSFNMSSIDMLLFDASSIFNVSCDAGLLVIQLGESKTSVCNIYDFNKFDEVKKQYGWANGMFCSDLDQYNNMLKLDGICPFEWRQGIKHDCSKVMELKQCVSSSSEYVNGLGEKVSFDLGKYFYPLVKSSDIKNIEITDAKKYVIVPQTKVNEDTSKIQYQCSTIWAYLECHGEQLNSRKSVIYKKSPKYSIFGIGDYSFAKYKVGISGFYKEPVFALIYGDYPIMLDDTCYFLSFDNLKDAFITAALLNCKENILFLKSVAFLDSKRPYTKEVLKRIDILKIAEVVGYSAIIEFGQTTKKLPVSETDFEGYIDKLKSDLN